MAPPACVALLQALVEPRIAFRGWLAVHLEWACPHPQPRCSNHMLRTCFGHAPGVVPYNNKRPPGFSARLPPRNRASTTSTGATCTMLALNTASNALSLTPCQGSSMQSTRSGGSHPAVSAARAAVDRSSSALMSAPQILTSCPCTCAYTHAWAHGVRRPCGLPEQPCVPVGCHLTYGSAEHTCSACWPVPLASSRTRVTSHAGGLGRCSRSTPRITSLFRSGGP